MKRSIYSPPDPFTLSPMVSLLPVRGKIGKLEGLTSSLYARFEKVSALQSEVGSSTKLGAAKRSNAEAAMLKQVLDWLSLKPQETAGEAEE